MKVVAYSFLDRTPLFTPLEALAVCKLMVKTDPATCPHGKKVNGECGHFAACNYGFSSLGFLTAADAWRGAPKQYKHHGLDTMKEAPAGALVFWTGGTKKAGHVGIADGKGNIFGTDLPDTNHYGRFPIDQVQDRFTLDEPAGWTFPYFPAAGSDNRHPPKLSVKQDESAHQRVVQRLIEDAQDSIAAARRGLAHSPTPELKAAYQEVIKAARRQIEQARGLLPA